MQISSTSSQNSIFGLANQGNTSKKPLVRPADSVVPSQAEQEKSLNKPANQAVLADQQAIAQFEQNQLAVNTTQSSASNESFSRAGRDRPSAQNETAVASYQSVGNLAQRESVQKLFGVDVFA